MNVLAGNSLIPSLIIRLKLSRVKPLRRRHDVSVRVAHNGVRQLAVVLRVLVGVVFAVVIAPFVNRIAVKPCVGQSHVLLNNAIIPNRPPPVHFGVFP